MTDQRTISFGPAFLAAACCLTLVTSPATAQEESAIPVTPAAQQQEITFTPMPTDQVQTQLLQWVAGRNVAKPVAEQVMQYWAAGTDSQVLSSEQLLDVILQTFALADEDVQKLVRESEGQSLPEVIETSGQSDFFSAQVQLFRARWLVQHRFYDDALAILDPLSPDDVVDPASLLFYRAICQSELLMTKEALDSLTLLQNNTLNVPDRFLVVAEMLRNELLEREDEGMKKVAELMTDVERRLDLGRSGQKTQTQEEAVIAALDKLLEDLENEKKKQQQQQQQGGQGQGQQQQNTTPAGQSQIKNGISANGEADPKNLEEKGQWGLLNNKQEAKAREMIQQKFPPNFLDQIGRYTRKIAEQKK